MNFNQKKFNELLASDIYAAPTVNDLGLSLMRLYGLLIDKGATITYSECSKLAAYKKMSSAKFVAFIQYTDVSFTWLVREFGSDHLYDHLHKSTYTQICSGSTVGVYHVHVHQIAMLLDIDYTYLKNIFDKEKNSELGKRAAEIDKSKKEKITLHVVTYFLINSFIETQRVFQIHSNATDFMRRYKERYCNHTLKSYDVEVGSNVYLVRFDFKNVRHKRIFFSEDEAKLFSKVLEYNKFYSDIALHTVKAVPDPHAANFTKVYVLSRDTEERVRTEKIVKEAEADAYKVSLEEIFKTGIRLRVAIVRTGSSIYNVRFRYKGNNYDRVFLNEIAANRFLKSSPKYTYGIIHNVIVGKFAKAAEAAEAAEPVKPAEPIKDEGPIVNMLAEKLKQLEKGIYGSSFGQALVYETGIHPNVYKRMLSGGTLGSEKDIIKIAKFYGIDPAELLLLRSNDKGVRMLNAGKKSYDILMKDFLIKQSLSTTGGFNCKHTIVEDEIYKSLAENNMRGKEYSPENITCDFNKQPYDTEFFNPSRETLESALASTREALTKITEGNPQKLRDLVARAAVVSKQAGMLIDATMQFEKAVTTKELNYNYNNIKKEAFHAAAECLRFILSL